MTIAYLVNAYPTVSHTFIRREILALESLGCEARRFSIQRVAGAGLDDANLREAERTRAVLSAGPWGLLGAVVRSGLTRPASLARALRVAWRIGRRSDRGRLINLFYVAEACVLLGWLRDCGATHVHAHFGTNPAAVAMLCRELGGPPYSFTVHGPEEFDKATVLALDEKIALAAFVVAISDFGRSQLFRWCDASHWPKVHVVRCGLDEEFFQRPLTPVPHEPRLVCVGRLCEQKGQTLLVEAAARLRDDGERFQLVLVGDGPMRQSIERLIDALGLRGNVTITGWAGNDAVIREILASRALVLPSFAEGLPVVLMEAMALGRPVITTRVAGIPELVEDGVSGWLVTPGSVEALVEGMRRALRASPRELGALGEAGRSAAALRHRARAEAEKLASLFRGNAAEVEATADRIPVVVSKEGCTAS